MAIHHASPGEVISIRPLKEQVADTKTSTLLQTDHMKVLRLVLPAGKKIAEHQAPSDITVQCLEGRIQFTSGGNPQELVAGDLLFLTAAAPHALEALEDSSVLVTILLPEKA
ncbi:cupin domain-containing protein [Roseimaritima ulvae]|uniref:Cupin domain protein n=1 Tax=Roseimaritima ulvae TaxID=980254 RepID=A0A5B9QNT4_9BACT|nr:cupin domain-containing protein [Roseimaritima ulvae]QEG39562.1 Cupin domain protein [Roseimaritima ulvae]